MYLDGRNPLEVLIGSQMYLHQVAGALAADRRETPGDDLISALVHAEVDGDRLTDAEIAGVLRAAGGRGQRHHPPDRQPRVKALTDFGDQRAWLIADFDDRIGGAVEEFVRWATPVMTFRRTAAADCRARRPGRSRRARRSSCSMRPATSTTTVFDAPERFDLSRKPNPHLGFGGGGRHFCLGAHVARAQLRALFGELLTQLPDIAAGEPSYVAGNFVHGVRSLPVHLLVRAGIGASSSASRTSSSEQPASSLTVANSSPRVGPRLMIATGMPAGGRVPDEPQAGEHRQRRAGDEQRVGVVDQ